MARVRPERIVDELESEFVRALRRAASEVLPSVDVDEYELFRAFKRAVSNECNTWKRVRDGSVDIHN